MKALREQIIEILRDQVSINSTKSVIQLADEILALNWVDKILALDMYPKEFVEWCFSEAFTLEEDENEMKYAVWYKIENLLKFKTLDELYEYWKNLPK